MSLLLGAEAKPPVSPVKDAENVPEDLRVAVVAPTNTILLDSPAAAIIMS
jgi:hypothetical protein